VVRFEHVGLRYGLGPEVLRDLTFRIDSRSFQFLTGPSGAGKTSLLRLLFLSLRPTRGLITLFGHDIATLSKDAMATLRRRMGIVFQDFRSTISRLLRTSHCHCACSVRQKRITDRRSWSF
jgi:cell division transport system ATP-binding protein